MVYDCIRRDSGRWLIRNCTVEGVDMLIDYHHGKDFCQEGRSLTDVTFENMRITGLKKRANLVPLPGSALEVTFRDVTMDRAEDGLFLTGPDVTLIFENSKIEGLNG